MKGLAKLNITTQSQLRRQPLAMLQNVLGEKVRLFLLSSHPLDVEQNLSPPPSRFHQVGTQLFSICRGIDRTRVVPSGAPKSFSVEDSFKGCTS